MGYVVMTPTGPHCTAHASFTEWCGWCQHELHDVQSKQRERMRTPVVKLVRNTVLHPKQHIDLRSRLGRCQRMP